MYEIFGSLGDIDDIDIEESNNDDIDDFDNDDIEGFDNDDIKRSEHPNDFIVEFSRIIDVRLNHPMGKIVIGDNEFSFVLCDITHYPNPSHFHQMSAFHHDLERAARYSNEELLKAPAEDSPQSIVNALTDDCLLQIFNELSAYDLSQAANVCQRFNGIAKQVFCSKYHQKPRSLMDDLNNGGRSSLPKVELCFRTFGSEIRVLHINGDDPNPEIVLRMCAAHCTKIKIFRFDGYKWNASIENSIRRMMPCLEWLGLCMSGIEPWAMGDLFVGNWPLMVLQLQASIDWTTTAIQLPNLRGLYLIGGGSSIKEQFFKRTLLKNPQIIKVGLYNYSISASMFNILPTYLPNCEELILDCRVGSMDEMGYRLTGWDECKALKSLVLPPLSAMPSEDIFNILAVNEVPLEVLSLQMHARLNEQYLIEYISQLRFLKTIKFHYAIDAHHDIDFDICRWAWREVVFSGIGIRINRIKDRLRGIVQPLKITIQPSDLFYISNNDCDEITDILEVCPEIGLRIEISRTNLIVSNFHFLSIVLLNRCSNINLSNNSQCLKL